MRAGDQFFVLLAVTGRRRGRTSKARASDNASGPVSRASRRPPRSPAAFWACEPIDVANAAGISPNAAVSEVITTGLTRSSAPRRTDSRTGNPAARNWLKYEIRSTPSCTATPKIEMNPTAAEMLNGV